MNRVWLLPGSVRPSFLGLPVPQRLRMRRCQANLGLSRPPKLELLQRDGKPRTGGKAWVCGHCCQNCIVVSLRPAAVRLFGCPIHRIIALAAAAAAATAAGAVVDEQLPQRSNAQPARTETRH